MLHRVQTNYEINRSAYIKAELISRPNLTNGKYRIGGLDQLSEEMILKTNDDDIFFLESLQMKANLADKKIAEAEDRGINTNDHNVMRKLGEEINLVSTVVHKNEGNYIPLRPRGGRL